MAEWTAWQVIVGLAGVLGLGALAGWYSQETLKQLLPTPRRVARLWRIWRGEVPRAKGTHFTVLITDLDGDADGSQTRHVEAALREHRGLDVLLVGQGPPAFDMGSRTEAWVKAERQGRTLLEQYRGDVLIFGEVAEVNTRLRLRFLPHHPGVAGGHASYQLQAAELPADFGADFNNVLLALVATSIAPATEQAGIYLVDLLRPAAGKLQQLLAHLPAGLDRDQCAGLAHSFALAATVLGKQTGESQWLEQAIAGYRKALKEWTRERAPLQWAGAQTNFGAALARLGEREDGTCRLEQAVAAFGAALEVYTRERFPLYWAATQTNLGIALRTLGERDKGTERGIKRLNQAAAAFGAALEEWTRARMPFYWAMTLTNLGSALTRLGEREQGTARLKQAIVAHCAALKVLSRGCVPLDWARTQNNLGNAIHLLGERQSSTKRLKEALAAYDNAFKEWRRERVPLEWAIAQNNRGHALRTLGQMESGTDRLEESVAAFRAALEVFRVNRASHYVGVTERDLARAEALLAARRAEARRSEHSPAADALSEDRSRCRTSRCQ